MRKLFAALTRSAFADRVSFSGNVLGKYPNYRSTNGRLFVEKLRGSLFDLFSQSEKLFGTRAAFCSLRSREFIKRGIADLTDDNLVVVQHEKPESVSFVVMPLDFVTDQRHGQHSTQTDAGSPRVPRPASQINGLTATLSRKLLTFFFALAVTVGVSVSAFGQSSPLPGFPPGVFQNRAAIDAPRAPSYLGPGDIKSNWYFYYGTRAYSFATLGNKLVNLCNSTGGTDVLCADASSSVSTGDLVIPGSLTSFCPGANCTIKTYYDISGNANCSSAACDATQLTIASRAILTASVIGSKSCGVGAGAATYTSNNAMTTISTAVSVSGVARFSSASGSPEYAGTNLSYGFGIQSGSFAFYNGGLIITDGTADTSPHAFQSIINNTASFIVTDASTSSLQAGGLGISGSFKLFDDSFGNFMQGAMCETGAYPAAFSGTDASNMYTNQHTYYGF